MATINGDGGPNNLQDTSGNDTINGQGGDDTITVTGGTDTVDGGDGTDRLVLDASAALAGITLSGLTGDAVSGYSGAATWGGNKVNLSGIENFSIRSAGNFTDHVTTGAGSDSFEHHGINDLGYLMDFVDLGDGEDTLIADFSGVTYAVANGPHPSQPGHGLFTVAGNGKIDYVNVEILAFHGGTQADNVTGFVGNDILSGDDGNDTLDGGVGGDDRLDGGAGADTMTGGTGNDTYVVDSFGDVVTENVGAGFDTVETIVGSRNDYDQLYYLPDNVENLTGTATTGQGIWGNNLDNVIHMGSGGDLVVLADRAHIASSAGGSDIVDGGGGNDYIFFGGGFDASDKVDGGTGVDTLGLLGTYDMTLGAQSLVHVEKLAMYSSGDAANPNNYTITTVDENVAAGQQLLVVATSLQAGEHLYFFGFAETDASFNVMGGHGGDGIGGGSGNDRFIGGGGADLMAGFGGNDVFQYNAVSDSTSTATDTILDFSVGDKVDLWFIDADGNAGDGDQRFAFIGTDAFHGVAGELRAVEDGNSGNWFVQGDTNGDGAADVVIDVSVTDGHAIAASDFVL